MLLITMGLDSIDIGETGSDGIAFENPDYDGIDMEELIDDGIILEEESVSLDENGDIVIDPWYGEDLLADDLIMPLASSDSETGYIIIGDSRIVGYYTSGSIGVKNASGITIGTVAKTNNETHVKQVTDSNYPNTFIIAGIGGGLS